MNNSTTYDGGGIFCNSSNPTIENSIISNNVVGNGGGGIYCASSSSPSLNNVTIAGNFANNNTGGIWLHSSGISINNSILWGNSLQAIYVAGGLGVIASYSDIQGGWEGEGNIDADPLFVNAEYVSRRMAMISFLLKCSKKSIATTASK